MLTFSVAGRVHDLDLLIIRAALLQLCGWRQMGRTKLSAWEVMQHATRRPAHLAPTIDALLELVPPRTA